MSLRLTLRHRVTALLLPPALALGALPVRLPAQGPAPTPAPAPIPGLVNLEAPPAAGEQPPPQPPQPLFPVTPSANPFPVTPVGPPMVPSFPVTPTTNPFPVTPAGPPPAAEGEASFTVPAADPVPATVAEAQIADRLTRLSSAPEPSLAQAVAAVTSLNELAATQAGEDRALTEATATLLRGVFTAEHLLLKAKNGVAAQDAKAAKKAKDAEAWLVPNSFGTVNRERYDAAVSAAEKMRADARQGFALARARLAATVNDTEMSLAKLHQGGHVALSTPLGRVVDRVITRSLEIPAPDTLTDEQLTEQLLGLALAAFVIGALINNADNAPPPQEFGQPMWQQIDSHASWYKMQNRTAEYEGRDHPYPGYGT